MQVPKSQFSHLERMPRKCTAGHAYNLCQHCRIEIGDEYHYLLCFPQFSHERTKYFREKTSAIQIEKNNEKSKSQKAMSSC